MLRIKIVRTFPSESVCNLEINKFQERLFRFSNFLGAAILNSCDASRLPY